MDSNGYPTFGYMRCSKVVRRPTIHPEDNSPDSGEGETLGHTSKKPRRGSDTDAPSADKDAAMALQSLGLPKASGASRGSSNGFDSHASDANTSDDSPPSDLPPAVEEEIEFVLVIRPADMSVPQGCTIPFQTYLSTASMVEHDRQRDDTMTGTAHGENARGDSPSGSVSNDSGSEDKFGSGSGSSGQSNLKISNGTSSEAGSDESDSA